MYKKLVITLAITLICTVLFVAFFYTFLIKPKMNNPGYQAVFLTNGQVYFGKIIDRSSKFLKLNDIYYLQLKQSLQEQDQQDLLSQSDLSLIKLGNELHGPEDSMEIVINNILFIENLSDDSKVVKAIRDYHGSESN